MTLRAEPGSGLASRNAVSYVLALGGEIDACGRVRSSLRTKTRQCDRRMAAPRPVSGLHASGCCGRCPCLAGRPSRAEAVRPSAFFVRMPCRQALSAALTSRPSPQRQLPRPWIADGAGLVNANLRSTLTKRLSSHSALQSGVCTRSPRAASATSLRKAKRRRERANARRNPERPRSDRRHMILGHPHRDASGS